MNSFTRKGIVRKIILILICLIVFNYIYPCIFSVTFATDYTSEEEKSTDSNVEKLRTVY